nr:ribonuclease H-like domain-containing protein [Tanacetum cinerariifolium]
HTRLGHPSDQAADMLHYDLNFSKDSQVSPCDICHKAKQTREPFPFSDHQTTPIGELIYLDLWSPYKVVTKDEFRYFLTIMDDYTRAVWINLIKTKDEVYDHFVNYIKLILNQFKCSMKTVRYDNGTEFVNNKMNNLFNSLVEALLAETVLEIETAPVALKNHLKLTQSFAHDKEITFPPLTANKGTGGPLVIESKIGGHVVHRIYADGGSSMEWGNYMAARTVKALSNYEDAEHYTKAWMNFMIVRSPSSYNGFIGRPGIREIQAIPSMTHIMLKFSVNGRIVTIRSTILTPTKCATIAATPKDPAKKAEACHENLKVAIHLDFSDQEITIKGVVSTKARTELCTLLKENLDIFAWQPSDMTGVPRSIAEHRLDIRKEYSPVKHKKRRQAPEARQGNPSRGAKIGRGRNSARSILP